MLGSVSKTQPAKLNLTAFSKICKCIVKLSIYSNSTLNKDGLMHIFKFFDEVY